MLPTLSTPHERVDAFAALGVVAFTTTREAGTFGLAGTDPVGAVMTRWSTLLTDLAGDARGIAVAPQVHGTTVLAHATPWDGWLRTAAADGHATQERRLALAVTVADCVPIFIAHPSGAVAMLHSGWRGTAGRMLDQGIRVLGRAGLSPDELHVHLGPAICGRCYEVSADVRSQLTGESATRPGHVDLRAIILEQARAAGVQHVTVSPSCTRCDNDRFFSHRAGDTGRQLAIIIC
jgi:YfiH family protein